MFAMDVYVSYDSKDESFARDLIERLTRSGLDVVNPDLDLKPGSNWLLEIGRALERSNGVVFVFSEKSAPPSLRKDFEYVISHPRYEGNVVSVLLSRNAEFPWILLDMPLVDASHRDADRAAKAVSDYLAPHRRRRVGQRRPRVKSPVSARSVRASKKR